MTDEEVEQIVPADRLAPLTRSFPVLLEVPCIRRLAEGSSDAEDPITMRRRGLQALKELLRRIAARRTLIVHVDDLHWCDADGTTLLTDLSAPPAIAGLLLIATFRSEEIESKPFLRDLLRGVDGEQVREIYRRSAERTTRRAGSCCRCFPADRRKPASRRSSVKRPAARSFSSS